LLLFDLLQKNIWEKSEKDSIGLTKYFNNHRDKYVWKNRGDLSIASCTTMEKANLVKKYLEDNKTIDQIKELVNEGATIHVLFSKGILEEGSSKFPKGYKITKGVSKIYNPEKNQYTIIDVYKIMEPIQKKLEETRGEVINDYQKELEERWTTDLRNKYHVKMNKKNLKKLKRQFDSL
jgi:peptidyl-prolyl cis-trans isomerase SurA